MLSPVVLLLLLIGFTALAAALSHWQRRRQSAAVATLAHAWHMRYVPDDRFDLAGRVAAGLPVPGAADVVVRDLVYGDEANISEQVEGDPAARNAAGLRYLFTVEYTIGIVRGKKRRVGVGAISERPFADGRGYSPVTLAPAELPVIRQYEHLKSQPAATAPLVA